MDEQAIRKRVDTAKKRIEDCFNAVREKNPKIFCGYVTLSERQNFHEKISGENDWAYPLFWWRQLNGSEPYTSKGAWQELLSKLHACIKGTI